MGTQISTAARHTFAVHDEHGVLRAWQAPAPDYRAADHCECISLIAATQMRPLTLSDMIPGVVYRPGSLLLSRFFPDVMSTTRIVGWVEPSARTDRHAALSAMLEGQDAAGRPALRQLLTYLAKVKQQSKNDWRVAEADIEQGKVVSLIQ